jgi:hypothetical protein
MTATCETCRFWAYDETHEKYWNDSRWWSPCRRFPMPQPVKAEDDWCGEHAPKGEERG